MEPYAFGADRDIELDGLLWRPWGESRPAPAAEVAVLDGYDIGPRALAPTDSSPPVRFWMHAPPADAAVDSHLDLGETGDGIGSACLRRSYWPGPAGPAPGAEVRSVLVTVGGGDAGGPVGELAGEVAGALPQARVTMVRGPQSRSAVPEGIGAIDSPDDLRPHLAASDLVVTAAGQTMLEAIATGVPTVALVRAENQRSQAELVDAAGAAVIVEESYLATALGRLAADPTARRVLTERAARAIDGLGAHYVADRLLGIHSGSEAFSCFGLELRGAGVGDATFLRELRNDPEAYPLYGSPRPVEPEEHRRWLDATLASPNRHLVIIEREGQACGQLRLDRLEPSTDPEPLAPWELSISLLPAAQGAGVGRRAIAAGALLAWVRRAAGAIRAAVHPENTASLRAFRSCGFVTAGRDRSGFELLELRRADFDWTGPQG